MNNIERETTQLFSALKYGFTANEICHPVIQCCPIKSRWFSLFPTQKIQVQKTYTMQLIFLYIINRIVVVANVKEIYRVVCTHFIMKMSWQLPTHIFFNEICLKSCYNMHHLTYYLWISIWIVKYYILAVMKMLHQKRPGDWNITFRVVISSHLFHWWYHLSFLASSLGRFQLWYLWQKCQ